MRRSIHNKTVQMLVAGAGFVFGAAAVASALEATIVSARPGLAFTDTERVDVRLRVKDKTETAVAEYAVAEFEGDWRDEGKVTITLAEGEGEAPLALKLPGRGLYELKVIAMAGSKRAELKTWVAVLFTPEPPDPESPWGSYFVPPDWYGGGPSGARQQAESIRRLGASWARLGMWTGDFGKIEIRGAGPQQTIKADYSRIKSQAKALRAEGVSILGNLCQIPREVSSRPDALKSDGSAGPMYSRVRPGNYALWEQLMEQLARETRGLIDVWELANEPDLKNHFWVGTDEELEEKLRRTSAALRRGNPEVRIAAAGIDGGHALANRLMDMGMGKYIDILTVHYTNERPDKLVNWQGLTKRHNLQIPIWNTEEISEAPLQNLRHGISKSFKFIHVDVKFSHYRPLVRPDLTLLPAGVAFSVAAHRIGTAQHAGTSDRLAGFDTHFFQRGDEMIVALENTSPFPVSAKASGGRVTLIVEPLREGEPVEVTDRWGRSRPLEIRGQSADLALNDEMLFINGARSIAVAKADVPAARAVRTFEAESGRWSQSWGRSSNKVFSGSQVVSVWTESAPDEGAHWVEVKFEVPAAGRYELLYSGNSPARLKAPRSISPFTWQIDGGKAHAATPALRRIGGAKDIGEGLYSLATVDLAKGLHTFRLELTEPRERPDKHYALWFDAIMVRPAQ